MTNDERIAELRAALAEDASYGSVLLGLRDRIAAPGFGE
jgi:hypothetical protein